MRFPRVVLHRKEAEYFRRQKEQQREAHRRAKEKQQAEVRALETPYFSPNAPIL